MRYTFHTVAALAAAMSFAPASAAELPNEAPDGKRWMSCFIRVKDAGSDYIGRGIVVGGYWLVDVPADARTETQNRLRDIWVREYASRIPSEFPGRVGVQRSGDYDARCNSFKSRGEWASFVAHVKDPVTSATTLRSDFVPSFADGWVSTREHARGYTGAVASSGGVVSKPAGEGAKTGGATATSAEAGSEDREAALEQERIKARAEREAEFQAKLAAHEAQVADYQRKVRAREEEIARQQQELAANAAAAASKRAAYQRELDAANRRQQEYFAAQRRHALCVGGDQKACADIAAGKPALGDQLADAGLPKTSDDEATTCVSAPAVGPSKAFKDAIAATVVNGCKAAVDVRICLMREGGWNCGVTWGLKPQDRWSHSSFKSSGEIFWDARMSGSNRSLSNPPGN